MTVAAVVLPVFALIAVGFAAARWQWLSAASRTGIAEFATTIALPALLFRTIATAELPPVAPLRIWAAYWGAVALAWLIATLATPLLLRRPPEDSAAMAMLASYGNTVMLGVPLCVSLYGTAAMAPMAILIAVTSPVYWTLATLHHQATMSSQSRSIGPLLVTVLRDLARNPIVVAILAGSAWRLSGIELPEVVQRPLALLGQAVVPSALVALGTSLVGFAIKGQGPTLALVLVLKLIAMPLVATGLTVMLALPPVAAGVVILFAATPTGVNAFLFSTKVERVVNSASGAIALGTILSIFTSSVIVTFLAR